MRHNSQGRRQGRHRGGNRHSGGGGGNNRAQVFDSNGPDVRIRGTAFQICEKYQALAKDAASMGDRVLAESYLQHAEHYQRVINQWHESNARHGNDTRQGQQQGETATAQQGNSGHADLGLPASITAGAKQNAKADTALEDA